jgi:5-hydroxyisourate hydrolase-like protein (transthyretin family)
MILAALAAGAAAGGKEAAASAVKDAYAGLKQLVEKRFSGKPSAEVALAEHEKDPTTWQAPLTKALAEAGTDRDGRILAAARRLLELTDPAGARAGRYTLIDARGAHHTQIGDHNRQINIEKGTYVEGDQTTPRP